MGEGVAFHHLARGVDVEQLGGHREHRLLGAPLDPVPRAAAELIELRLLAVAADIALDQVDAFHRDVHRIAGGVLQRQEVALGAGDFHVA